MDTLEEDRIRLIAAQAQQMLENPLFQRHNDQVRQEILQAWIDSGDDLAASQTQIRENLWHKFQAVETYINTLRQYLYSAQQLPSEDDDG